MKNNNIRLMMWVKKKRKRKHFNQSRFKNKNNYLKKKFKKLMSFNLIHMNNF